MNRYLLLMIALSIFLRFYQLGTNPPSLTWDEASLGYNAYSILKTGRDEYGNKFPISIRSFDDYKPPLYVYLDIIPVKIFGLNELAVRFPSALLGTMTVLVMYFLVKEMFGKRGTTQINTLNNAEIFALLSSLFLAISPWSLQFSRAAFEGNVGLFFLMLGALLFFKGLRDGRLFILSSLSFVLSIYSYHSFRLLIPLFLLSLGLLFWRELRKQKLFFIASFVLLILFAAPVYLGLVRTQGSGSRLSMVSIFSEPKVLDSSIKRIEYDKKNNDQIGQLFHNRRIAYGLSVAKGYLDHFNPDFLFFHGDGGIQHHASDMGMLYLWDLPFIILGAHFLLNRRNRYIGVLFLLFLLAPIPSAITTGTPHPVRAIAMMPGFHIFSAVGVFFILLKILTMKRFIGKLFFLGIIVVALLLNFMYYMHQYYVHTPIEYGYFWQYGYKEALSFAKENETKFDKIIVSYKYDQPYIYYLFYNKIDPSLYQKNWDYNKTGLIDRFKRVIGKYEFRNIDYSKDSVNSNTLLIGTPDEIPDSVKALKSVKFPDGRVAFKIVKT